MKLFLETEGRPASPYKAALNVLLVCIVVIAFFWISLIRISIKLDFGILAEYPVWIWQGFKTTVLVSLVSLVLSLPTLLPGTSAAETAEAENVLPDDYVFPVREYEDLTRGVFRIIRGGECHDGE